mgnify:CR=1 FL=1
MSNNMDLGYEMFCYQCEQTANGKGCTKMGVCGKTPEIANLQDLLIYQAKGICCYAKKLLETGEHAPKEVVRFLENVLFTTLTNVNFDADVHVELLKVSQNIKEELREQTETEINRPAAVYNLPETKSEMLKDAPMAGIMYDKELDEDIRSLRQTILYGLKGISAYGHQARELGYYSTQVDDFYIYGLEALTDDALTVEELIRMTMRTGEMALEVMKQLDEANTSVYGNPYPHKVSVRRKKGPFIIVSGHDFKDLEMLLEQTQGTGVDVYTHSEMLPAHYYPAFKKYQNFVGNYGNAWWKQKDEFEAFHGPILMTTNCIVPPKDSYKDRLYTTGAAGYPGCQHIGDISAENGSASAVNKDFTVIIEHAKKCAPPAQIEEGEIIGGFAHAQVLALADQIVAAVKSGSIKKFVVMAGCDGRAKSRNYYSDFAKALPKDTVILTAGCAKYKYNKLNLGDINGIPRVLDAGQCNDSYSLAVIALKLKEVFGLDDINELPIIYNIAWYEQKAVIVLLSLLYLGVKNIHLGPTLPAFLSPNVAKVLMENFGIAGIDTVENDMKLFFEK